MRPYVFSFLFFYVALFQIAGFNSAGCFGQVPRDSLHYYYNALLLPRTSDDLPDGIAYYTRRVASAEASHDTLVIIDGLRMIAIGQFKIGDAYGSERTIVQALEVISQNRASDTLVHAKAGLYNQLGRIYRSMQHYPASLDAFDRALEHTSRAPDSITLLNNKANIFKDLEQFDRALEHYRLIYLRCRRQGDSILLAMVLDNMGAVLSEMHAAGAQDTLLKALQIRRRHKELTGVYSSYKNLARHHRRRYEASLSRHYADLAYETALTLNSGAFRYDALELLMALNPDPHAAEYHRLTDSLSGARQRAENKYAFVKYNLSEERKKTAAEELQGEKEKRSKQLFQLSTGFILVILILSYFIFRYRYRKGQQEAMYRTESRISKKVHDELANEVFNVMAFAESKNLGGTADREKLLTSLDKLYTKTRDISKDNSWIPTGADYPLYLKEHLAGYTTDRVNIIIKGLDDIQWRRIAKLKKLACFRVLQELMVNTKKHSGATLVLITFQQSGSRVKIAYSDNGSGISTDVAFPGGGLRNAENRIEAVDGTFTFDSGLKRGFRCRFSFPV